MERSILHNCPACFMLSKGEKFTNTPSHTCNTTVEYFKDRFEFFVKDGIVYVRDKSESGYTVYLKARPGIVCQVENVEDAPLKIKEIIDSITGWDE